MGGVLYYCLATVSSTLGLASLYYLLAVVKKPKINTGNVKMRKFLLDHVKTLDEAYWPPFLYWNGVLQSILGLIKRIPNSQKLPYDREILTLRDGGEVGLDYLPAKEGSENGKKLTVLFLPGLTSSSQTCYVKTLSLAVTRAGANIYVFNNRGLGGVSLKTPKSYSAATIDDLIDVLQHLKKKYPEQKFLLIGTSFGSITICRYLIKRPEEAKNFVLGALVISAVFDLEGASKGIETPINKYILNYQICKDLVYRFKKFGPILQSEPWYNLDKANKCKTVRDFDREITSQAFGFKSDKEYYQECSSVGLLHKLPVPVYSLSAVDDPFQYGKYLPFDEANKSDSKLTIISMARGGHLGFLEGITAKDTHFMERFAGDFIQSVLQYTEQFTNL